MGFQPKGISKLSELTIDDAPDEAKDIAELVLTTKGDILYRNDEAARLGKGTLGQLLRQAALVPVWGPSPIEDICTTLGDILYRNAVSLARLGRGTTGQLLKQGALIPVWGPSPIEDICTTRGDILYRDAVSLTRLQADYGLGMNFLHMSNTGQLEPEWTDIQSDIIYITGAVNRIIKLATLVIPGPPAISLAVAEDHSGGAHVYNNALPITMPSIGEAAEVSSVLIDDCEDAWNEYVQANVTSTADGVTYKIGAASAKMAVADGAAVGRLATEVVSVNLSPYKYLKLWVRSSIELDAADISILLDEHAQCVSPLKDLSLPEIAADTWTELLLDMGDTSGCTAIISIGVDMDEDKGIFDFWVDQVRATKGGV